MSASADPSIQRLDDGATPSGGSFLVESIPEETPKARHADNPTISRSSSLWSDAKPGTATGPTGDVAGRGDIKVTRPAVRYHGGKFRLAPWVISHFPPHKTYVEPFGGAASVLLQKPRVYAEIYNDLDGDVVNLFQVLRDPDTRADLIEQCVLTPYAREEFELAWEFTDATPVERARRLVIRAQMGFGSAGATKGRTGFRLDSKRAYGTAQHLWAEYPESLAAVGARLTGVLIEHADALTVMRQHDGPQTLHYVDPPYLPATRVLGGNRYYRHEMSVEQHEELLSGIINLEGMVVLSGYPSSLYDAALVGWEKTSTEARISAARGTALRTECLWLNPLAIERLHGGGLFA